jgi:hypothetical protein
MKARLILFLFIFVSPALTWNVAAQDSSGTAPTLADLRAQLADVQAKETELQTRARQLGEELKPENIERSLAGIGSTRPEELRESRRRQLTIERDGVRAQLKLVATSRERLETVIQTAETQAYQQSAEEQSMLNQAVLTQKGSTLTVAIVSAVVLLFGLVFVFALIKHRGRA